MHLHSPIQAIENIDLSSGKFEITKKDSSSSDESINRNSFDTTSIEHSTINLLSSDKCVVKQIVNCDDQNHSKNYSTEDVIDKDTVKTSDFENAHLVHQNSTSMYQNGLACKAYDQSAIENEIKLSNEIKFRSSSILEYIGPENEILSNRIVANNQSLDETTRFVHCQSMDSNMNNELLLMGQMNHPLEYDNNYSSTFSQTMFNIKPIMMNKGEMYGQVAHKSHHLINGQPFAGHQMNREFSNQFNSQLKSSFFNNINSQYNEFTYSNKLIATNPTYQSTKCETFTDHLPVDAKFLSKSFPYLNQTSLIKDTNSLSCPNVRNIFDSTDSSPNFISQQSLFSYQNSIKNQSNHHESNSFISNFYANNLPGGFFNIAQDNAYMCCYGHVKQSNQYSINNSISNKRDEGETYSYELLKEMKKVKFSDDLSDNSTIDEHIKYQSKKRQLSCPNQTDLVNMNTNEQVNVNSDTLPTVNDNCANFLINRNSPGNLNVDYRTNNLISTRMQSFYAHEPIIQNAKSTMNPKKKRFKSIEANNGPSSKRCRIQMKKSIKNKNLSNEILEQNRNKANTQERKRMFKINQALDKLRRLILSKVKDLDLTDIDTRNLKINDLNSLQESPLTPSPGSSDNSAYFKPRKLSKIMTLRLATLYIKKLMSMLND